MPNAVDAIDFCMKLWREPAAVMPGFSVTVIPLLERVRFHTVITNSYDGAVIDRDTPNMDLGIVGDISSVFCLVKKFVVVFRESHNFDFKPAAPSQLWQNSAHHFRWVFYPPRAFAQKIPCCVWEQ